MISKRLGIAVLLLTVFFLGFFFRIHNLGKESFWLDEAASVMRAQSTLFETIRLTGENIHLPLYPVILHLWLNLFGSSELAVRSLSAIFGFLSILMIYKVGCLLFGKEVGILSSLILALAQFHIRYSQEARMYSLLAFLTLLSMYFFLQLFQTKRRPISIYYILASTCLMYTHIHGVFVIVAQNIYLITLLLFAKDSHEVTFKRWVLLQLALLFLFLPWVSVLIEQVPRAHSQLSWLLGRPGLDRIIGSLRGYSGSDTLFYIFLLFSFLSIVIFEKISGHIVWKNLFTSLESYRWRFRLSSSNRIYLLVLWLVTPNILPFIISRLLSPIYGFRYTIGASLAFYILAAKGISGVSNKQVKLFIVAIVMILSLQNVRGYFSKIHKAQWRDAAKYVEVHAQQRDLLLFNPGYDQIPFDYYSKRTDTVKRAFPAGTEKSFTQATVDGQNIVELGAIVPGHKRIWLIQQIDPSGDPEKLINKTLGESYSLLEHRKYNNILVHLFEAK